MIEMSDAILVVNKDGYIGDSTKEEIKWAEGLHKEIKYYATPLKMPGVTTEDRREHPYG
jgi:hypothetical protein